MPHGFEKSNDFSLKILVSNIEFVWHFYAIGCHMDSMYDKLGELLSGALDSGFIPQKEKKSAKGEEFSQDKKQNKIEKNQENHHKRKLSENEKQAFAQIKIPENATFDEAKKIYREKLKYYHPDTKNDNPVLQKVAKEKTEALLSNWKIVEEYFTKS